MGRHKKASEVDVTAESKHCWKKLTAVCDSVEETTETESGTSNRSGIFSNCRSRESLKAGHWVKDREHNRRIKVAQNLDFCGIMDETSRATTELFYGLNFCINEQGYSRKFYSFINGSTALCWALASASVP
jgi:hypothetical protein